jgi:hypothetical protein
VLALALHVPSMYPKKMHFLLLYFAADECLRLQPRLGLLFSAAYG